MKHDITKTDLWKCYRGVLPEWWGTGGETNVGSLVYELSDAIVKAGGSDDDLPEGVSEAIGECLRKMGAAFIDDMEEIADTGAADVIDEVMDAR